MVLRFEIGSRLLHKDSAWGCEQVPVGFRDLESSSIVCYLLEMIDRPQQVSVET